jgi:long-chain acyl-CoA synthetase
MESMADLGEAFAGLEQRFRPGAVDHETVYYLSLGDAPSQKWSITITPTSCQIRAGKTDNADCVLKTSAALFVELISERWKPGPMDFLAGKIKTNDIDLLRRLQQSFGL